MIPAHLIQGPFPAITADGFTTSGAVQAGSATINGLVSAQGLEILTPDSYPIRAHGYYALGRGGSPQYFYPIATLPASSSGTADYIIIDGEINSGWTSGWTCSFELLLGNRGGFTYRLNVKSGVPTALLSNQVSIVAYQRTTGETDIYLTVASGTFFYCDFDVRASNQVILTPPNNFTYTTTPPTGTYVYDLTYTGQNFPYNAVVWQAPALGANIANYNNGWMSSGYAKDPTGRVSLRGLIYGNGLTLGATIFTLPAGFVPFGNELFTIIGSTPSSVNLYRLNVFATGVVSLDTSPPAPTTGAPTSWLSLGGVSFMAGY